MHAKSLHTLHTKRKLRVCDGYVQKQAKAGAVTRSMLHDEDVQHQRGQKESFRLTQQICRSYALSNWIPQQSFCEKHFNYEKGTLVANILQTKHSCSSRQGIAVLPRGAKPLNYCTQCCCALFGTCFALASERASFLISSEL